MSAATAQASQAKSLGSAPTSTRPTRQTGNGRKPVLKQKSIDIRAKIHQSKTVIHSRIHPSLPLHQASPIPCQFDRKIRKSADVWCPKFSGSLPSCSDTGRPSHTAHVDGPKRFRRLRRPTPTYMSRIKPKTSSKVARGPHQAKKVAGSRDVRFLPTKVAV